MFGIFGGTFEPLTAYAADVGSINSSYSYDQAYFDLYTDSDLLYQPTSAQSGKGINDYKTQLYRSGSTTTVSNNVVNVSTNADDPITKIVPRQLFERRGTYLHIGREYGFYVNTTQLDNNAYENKSVVLVFDIIKYPLNNPSYPSQYVIEIRPIFEYTYYYLTDNNSFATGNSLLKYNVSSLTSVVAAVPIVTQESESNTTYYYYTETTTYFLKDISFGLSLYNEQELNIGDSGYNRTYDNGSFITRANINFSGVSNQALIGATAWTTLKFGLGFFTYLGDAISIIEYGVELVQNVMNDFKENIEYGDYYNTQYYNSKAEQLAHYPNLNKSALAQLLSDDTKPLLFGRSNENNYVRGVFTLGMTEDWYTRVIDTIQLSVVTESTNFITGNSTITSRTTSDRSSRTNIRTLQSQSVTLENSRSFTLLPNGIAKFNFQSTYASDYTLTIGNASQMSIKIDGSVVSFSNNQLTKFLSSGTHTIEISGSNTTKLTSSIIVTPKSIAASAVSTSLSIPMYANYIIKVTSLSQVKALATGNPNVVIKALFTNNSWYSYTAYGAISPTAKLTHPFVPGNYYILLENKSSVSTNIAFTIAEPAVLSSNLSITMDGANYTYVKFTAPETAEYAITLTNMGGASFIVRKNDSTLSSTTGGYFPGNFYKDSFSAGTTYYVGVKNDTTTSNTITINKAGVAYQWKITGGANVTTAESTYFLTRNETYTLGLLVNGISVPNVTFEYVNQSTSFGIYVFRNPTNTQIKLEASTPIGGNGIRVYAWVANSNGQPVMIDRLDIIPKFEEIASITGMINGEDMQFKYSIPKFVTGIRYKIYPYSTEFVYYLNSNKDTRINLSSATNGKQGEVSFLANYNTLGNTYNTSLYIDIVGIYYVDAFNDEHYVGKSILSSYSMPSLFESGSGTLANPYIISKVRHFNSIAKTASSSYYYKQSANLNFNESAHDLHTKYFYGIYDGSEYSLDNISYTISLVPQASYIGGFCSVNYGAIKNLNINYLKIVSEYPNHDNESSWLYVGGVSGRNYGLLQSVDLRYGSIKVHHMLSYVGGITGYNNSVNTSRPYYPSGNYNYSMYDCNIWNSTTVFANGYVGGIVGDNNDGMLYSCWTGSDTRVELYQIYANNRGAGGIVGYNYQGQIYSCYNYATIAFVTLKAEIDGNKSVAPYIGKIAGVNYGLNNLVSSGCGGSLDAGSLITYKGFLGIGSYDQKKYFGAYCDQGIGYNNP